MSYSDYVEGYPDSQPKETIRTPTTKSDYWSLTLYYSDGSLYAGSCDALYQLGTTIHMMDQQAKATGSSGDITQIQILSK